MYPFIRLMTSCLKAKLAQPIAVSDCCETTFRCRPWDLDLYLEVNNGRMLTLYDLGRFDLAIRIGLDQVLKRQRWGFAVAGSSVRYRKRVRMFDKVSMRTQLEGMDERWIYISQSMWVKGEPVSSVLLRTAVTGKDGAIPVDEVRRALKATDWNPDLPVWVQAWVDGDSQRPWPPEF